MNDWVILSYNAYVGISKPITGTQRLILKVLFGKSGPSNAHSDNSQRKIFQGGIGHGGFWMIKLDQLIELSGSIVD
jgi:hypothetical protein